MRGRKPTPTKLRILRGNPSRRPLPTAEPTPAPTVGPPPEWLPAAARDEWARLAPLLERIGVLTEADHHALILFCQTWIVWRQASAHIAKHGLIVKARSGRPIVSPHVGIAQKALDQLRGLVADFGMTPSSRSRVTAIPPAPPADEWAGLLP
jgi:P27 family predicted phage terminase small subunit